MTTPDVAAAPIRPRILLVDDQADVQDVVAELLTGVGYDVDAVASGEDALDAVACRPYDLVISDLRLPGCSGTALIGEIARRRPRLANRIILLTGELGDLAGSLPVIRKPFSVDDVLHVVAAHLFAA
ncbi:MAG: hypothetical protein AUH29_06615 [Candidatus Rokubacteria bacterium 13_1_40CM_69_27]|nr:MAG: hypothetical protein AUH29_06615 [Candidatus Rokubacteria bacterium 13_1_40CM_69_27]OLC35924.1 MAG: hypothetical protein AUH81_08930 [Candidatus Rokubacteria bacterium 13_1_40CM_4_69_5]OLE38759.1 MAG: hypothetical protein AUG00_04560 [Candidatus Rokubacteria bacterium 13_1_20CM_2_70_7]